MTRQTRRVSLISAIVLGLILVLAIFCVIVLYSARNNILSGTSIPPIVATAEARVKIGDSREAALTAFADAWFHGDCTNSDGSGYDLFLYGPNNIQTVQVVVIRSSIEQGTARVTFIGTDENDRLFLYKRCLPESFFKK